MTDGAGLVDIRSALPQLDASVSKCPGDSEVCCQLPKFAMKTTTTTTEPPSTSGL